MWEENEPESNFSRATGVVPAHLELLNLFNDALRYFPAAGHDQSSRHQVKRAAWVEKREHCCSDFWVCWPNFNRKGAFFFFFSFFFIGITGGLKH